jgi:VCBS repeat-containing protein
VAVSAGALVSAADIAAGRLVFTPAADASGDAYASFTFQVQAAGGGADLDATPNSFTINVLPVNDAPTVSGGAADRQLVEAGVEGPGTATATASAIVGSDADGDTLAFDLSGWTEVGTSTSYTRQGVYGLATLDASTGVVSYQLDNSDADTEALSAGQTVTDSFEVTVGDGHGGTASASVVFTIAGATDSGSGDDVLNVGGGDDQVSGQDGDDEVRGHGGDDTLSGDAGDDSVFGGTGNDLLGGGDDADLLKGQSGDDSMLGGVGDDTLDGGAGLDVLSGGSGADRLKGQGGADLLDGGLGADTLLGGDGDDSLAGGADSNILAGGDGADQLSGGGDADRLSGGKGADVLDGGGGGDLLIGGADDDVLRGGSGADTLDGGHGADRYVFDALGDSRKAAPDLITHLEAQDLIDLSAIDADTTLAGDQAFILVSGFDHRAGEAVLSYDHDAKQTQLMLDIDGDAKADFVLDIAGKHADFTGLVL